MVDFPLIEIREPALPVRRVVVNRAMEVGRECDGELLDDEGVSRRHVKLLPSPLGLSVVDLGSRNGTLINGVALVNRTNLEPGDVVRLGDTELVVVAPSPHGSVDPEAKLTMIGALLPQQSMPVPAPPALPPPPVVPSKARTFSAGCSPVPTRHPTCRRFRNYMEIPRRTPIWMWHAVRTGSFLLYIALCIGLVRTSCGCSVRVLQGHHPDPADPVLRRPRALAQHLPAGCGQPGPARASASPRPAPRRNGWADARIRDRHRALLRYRRRSPGAVQHQRDGHRGPAARSRSSTPSSRASRSRARAAGAAASARCCRVQRVYGQTPFVTGAQQPLQPCVGCTKNCYDFKPRVAYQADLHDPDPQWSAPRKLFVGALPGFVLGFFTLLGRTRVHAGISTAGWRCTWSAASAPSSRCRRCCRSPWRC